MILTYVLKFFEFTGAAHRAADAIRNGKQPSANDRRILGFPEVDAQA